MIFSFIFVLSVLFALYGHVRGELKNVNNGGLHRDPKAVGGEGAIVPDTWSDVMSMRMEEPQHLEWDDPNFKIVYNVKYPAQIAPYTRNGFMAKSKRNMGQADLQEKQSRISEQMLAASGLRNGAQGKHVKIPDFNEGREDNYPDNIHDFLDPNSLSAKIRRDAMDSMAAERLARADYYARQQEIEDHLLYESYMQYLDSTDREATLSSIEDGLNPPDMIDSIVSESLKISSSPHTQEAQQLEAAPSSELAFEGLISNLGFEGVKMQATTATPTFAPTRSPTRSPTVLPTFSPSASPTLRSEPTNYPTSIPKEKKHAYFVYVDQTNFDPLTQDDIAPGNLNMSRACTAKRCKVGVPCLANENDFDGPITDSSTQGWFLSNSVVTNSATRRPIKMEGNYEIFTGINEEILAQSPATQIVNIQFKTNVVGICNFRTAMAYCLEVIPWYTGLVESCTIVLRPNKVHVISDLVHFNIKSVFGRFPVNIIIDGQYSKIRSTRNSIRFLTTHLGNDTHSNIFNFTNDQSTIVEVIRDEDLRRNLASVQANFTDLDMGRYSEDALFAEDPAASDFKRSFSGFSDPMSSLDEFSGGDNPLFRFPSLGVHTDSEREWSEGDSLYQRQFQQRRMLDFDAQEGDFIQDEDGDSHFLGLSTEEKHQAVVDEHPIAGRQNRPSFRYRTSRSHPMLNAFFNAERVKYFNMSSTARLAMSSIEIKNLNIGDKPADSVYSFGMGQGENGGALRLAGIKDLTLTNVRFVGCDGEFGGALFVYDARNIKLDKVIFDSNNALNSGGAAFIYDVLDVTIAGSTFKNNVAVNIGGAVALDSLESLTLGTSTFSDNAVADVKKRNTYAGGLSLVRVHGSAIVTGSTFERNSASFGSAVTMAAVNGAQFTRNDFKTNKAHLAGTVYWLFDSGMGDKFKENPAVHADYAPFFDNLEKKFAKKHSSNKNPKQFLRYTYFSAPNGTNNDYTDNTAGLYGAEGFSTEPMNLTFAPDKMKMMNYSSFAYPVQTTAIISDYYSRETPLLPGTMAKLFKPERKYIFCSFNTDNAVIVGNDTSPIRTGRALFNRFKMSCIPGGNMFIAISAQVDSSHFYFPSYMNQSQVGLRRFPFYSTRDVTGMGRVRFRSCINGEKYDFFTATRSTCSTCVRRYSFYFLGNPYNATQQAGADKNDQAKAFTSECDVCPLQAKYCIGDQILLHKDTFRWRHNSTRIWECPLSGGCLGGNVTGYGSCNLGYVGAWCGVCAKGFYHSRSENTCRDCNGKSSSQFTFSDIMFFVLASLAILIPLSIWLIRKYFKSTEDEEEELLNEMKKLGLKVNDNSDKTRGIRDALIQVKTINKAKYASWMSRAKITLVTYQIVIQSPMTLQMDFPKAFTDFMKSLNLINLDFIKVIPIGCYNNWTFIENMMATTLIPSGVFAFLLLLYLLQVIQVVLFERDDASRKMEEKKLRIRYFTTFLLFLYLILPGFSALIFETFDCVNVDPFYEVHGRSDPQILLRTDFSVDCLSPLYARGEQWAYWMVGAYPVGLPCFYLFILYVCRHEIMARDSLEKIKNAAMVRGHENKRTSKQKQQPRRYYQRLSASIGFMYMAYEPKYWFWEFIEVTRRLLLTAVLSLAFSGSIAQVTISIAVSLIYIKIYNQYKPYVLQSEDSLAEMGQYQIFFTFFAASIMRQKSLGAYAELYVMMDYLLIVVNLFAIFLNMYYFVNDIQDAITVRKQVAEIGRLAKEENFDLKSLQAITSKFTINEEEREKQEEMENERKQAEQAKSEPIKLIKEKWRTNFDVSNKEDLRLFVEIVNNMSDDDIFRMQAMIYENIVRYDRKYDEKIWIYCHDPVFLGSLEDIKSAQPRENALMHAVPLRVDYGDGGGFFDDDEGNSGIKTIPIPKYMKELLEMDDIGFDSSIFKTKKKVDKGEKHKTDVENAEEARKDDQERKDDGSDSDSEDGLGDDLDYHRENKEADDDDDNFEAKQAADDDDDDDVDEDDRDNYQKMVNKHKQRGEKALFNVDDEKSGDEQDSEDGKVEVRIKSPAYSKQQVETKEQLDREAETLFGEMSDNDDNDGGEGGNSRAMKSTGARGDVSASRAAEIGSPASQSSQHDQDDHLDNYENVQVKSKGSNARRSFGDGNSSVSEMEVADVNKMKRNMLKNKRNKRQFGGSDTSDGDTDASAMFNGPRTNGFMNGNDDVLFEEEEEDRESHHSKDVVSSAMKNAQRVVVDDDDDDNSLRSGRSGGLNKSASGHRLMPGANSDNDSHYKFNANFLDSDGANSDRGHIAQERNRAEKPPLHSKTKASTWADDTDDNNEIRGASKVNNKSKKITVKLEDQSQHSDYSTEREIEILDSDRERLQTMYISPDNNNAGANNPQRQGGQPKSGW